MPHARNPEIARGIERYGRVRSYHNKGAYKVKNRNTERRVAAASEPKVKPVGGKANGGQRTISRKVRYYSTVDRPFPLRNHKNPKPAKLRPSLVPGAVLIVLAGRYAGKRVVFLKQLESGLLLVTGPYKINGVPLRRLSQAYVIATKTVVDLGNLNVPENVNDAYFAKPKAKKTKKTEEDFFAEPEKSEGKKKPSSERIADQKTVDAQVLAAVGKSTPLAKYLKAHFTLTKGQYPHEMVF